MKRSIIIIFVLISIYSLGQTDISNKAGNQKPYIEVVGTASSEVIPDKIFISIVLSEKVINNEKYTIQKQEEKLKKSLEKLNTDLNNLYLADANSEITKYKSKETGFKVSKEYTLMVKTPDEVSKVFKELYDINIKEASILKVENSKIESLRKEVRIAAIKAAKDKAEYLLAAIGEQLDKPLEIREQENKYYNNPMSNAILNLNDANNNENEINFEKFTIKFSYYIKYAIK